jgi:hypothetical protein
MSEQIDPNETIQDKIDNSEIELDLAKAGLLIEIQKLSDDMEKARHMRNIRENMLDYLNAPRSH